MSPSALILNQYEEKLLQGEPAFEPPSPFPPARTRSLQDETTKENRLRCSTPFCLPVQSQGIWLRRLTDEKYSSRVRITRSSSLGNQPLDTRIILQKRSRSASPVGGVGEWRGRLESHSAGFPPAEDSGHTTLSPSPPDDHDHEPQSFDKTYTPSAHRSALRSAFIEHFNIPSPINRVPESRKRHPYIHKKVRFELPIPTSSEIQTLDGDDGFTRALQRLSESELYDADAETSPESPSESDRSFDSEKNLLIRTKDLPGRWVDPQPQKDYAKMEAAREARFRQKVQDAIDMRPCSFSEDMPCRKKRVPPDPSISATVFWGVYSYVIAICYGVWVAGLAGLFIFTVPELKRMKDNSSIMAFLLGSLASLYPRGPEGTFQQWWQHSDLIFVPVFIVFLKCRVLKSTKRRKTPYFSVRVFSPLDNPRSLRSKVSSGASKRTFIYGKRTSRTFDIFYTGLRSLKSVAVYVFWISFIGTSFLGLQRTVPFLGTTLQDMQHSGISATSTFFRMYTGFDLFRSVSIGKHEGIQEQLCKSGPESKLVLATEEQVARGYRISDWSEADAAWLAGRPIEEEGVSEEQWEVRWLVKRNIDVLDETLARANRENWRDNAYH